MKVVFDTSVLIAAFLKQGFSDKVLRNCIHGNLTLYTSKEILEELDRKLKTKFHLPENVARVFVSFVREKSIVVKPTFIPQMPKLLRDESHLFACAKNADADILVTLDRALLRMKRFENIVILHPRTLLWTFPEKK